MAHAATNAVSATTSAAAAAASTSGEINYFFQDANGKIIKVLKPMEIKEEDIDDSKLSTAAATTTTAVYTTNNMGAYNQMNSHSNQFVRIQNNYNMQGNEATQQYRVITPQSSSSAGSSSSVHAQSHGTIKYENLEEYNGAQSTSGKEERYAKYNAKIKSKLHSTVNTTPISVQKKRKPDKAGKGLRHFSMKVCEKVKEKGTTTYNEVADELVAEEIQNNNYDTNCDQKNIRRRVYDALNVLMAIQIISKDKKEIRWIGLPSNSMEQCTTLEKENEDRRERIKQKHQQLHDLLLQQVAFKSLIERNKEAESQGLVPSPNSSIQLPFIIVNTHKQTKINCSVTNDKSEYIFKFDDSFEMHDDAVVLKRLGLFYGLDNGECSFENVERAKSLVPPNFEKYIEAYGYGKGYNYDSDDGLEGFVEVNQNTMSHSQADGMKTPDLEDDEDIFDASDID